MACSFEIAWYYEYSKWLMSLTHQCSNNFFKQVDGHNNYGGLDSTPLSRSEEAMLDLEFTLGRPNWQKDHTESSRELTLLKC